MPHFEQPARKVLLSAYYDAAASNKETDFGTFLSTCPEDTWFSSGVRAIAIGRLRREVRNNSYLAGLFAKYPEAIGASSMRARTPSREENITKDSLWFAWKKAVTPAGDSLRSLEEIIYFELLVAGEIFFVKLASGHLQAITSEFCGSAALSQATLLANGEVNGIVYDSIGRPTHYRFGKALSLGGIDYADSTLVPAEFVIHVFHKNRVHMGRGLPWLLASLKPAHDLYEITRAKTKQIKDVNNISGTLETERPVGSILPGLTSSPEREDSPADKETSEQTVIELKPGTVISLRPGEKLNLLKAEYAAQDYKELIMLMLHAISSPVGLPVELWFSGLGDVNYSGFKGLGTQWNSRRRHIIAFIEEKFLEPVQLWWAERETILGRLDKRFAPDLVEWAWKQTAVLDREKEARANKTRLESGEATLAEIWEENGLYLEEVLAKRREEWIKLLIATGELEEGGATDGIIVPREFLYRGRLPGEQLQGAASNNSAPRIPADEPAAELQ